MKTNLLRILLSPVGIAASLVLSFSISASGDRPEEGVYSANRRNELAWTESLDPSETRTLRYRYDVLVAY